MAFSFNSISDKALWDEFVQNSPQGSVFSQSGFLDCYRLDYDLCAVEDDGKILAAVAICKDSSGVPVRAPLPFGQYLQTILFAPNAKDEPVHSYARRHLEVVEFLLARIWEKYGQISLFLHHSFTDIRPISWFHYHEPHEGIFDTKVFYTGVVDLSQFTEFNSYLRSVRRSRRQDYEGGGRKGLVISEENDTKLLLDLYQHTFDRQNLEVENLHIELLERMHQFAQRTGSGKMLVCRDADRRPIATTLFLHDRTTAYYFIAANHPDSRNLGAGPYLLLENFRRYFEAGIRKIDLVGINSPNRGDFKISFNAEPKAYFICNCVKPRLGERE